RSSDQKKNHSGKFAYLCSCNCVSKSAGQLFFWITPHRFLQAEKSQHPRTNGKTAVKIQKSYPYFDRQMQLRRKIMTP
ncbi:MAG: hypothetical protein ACK59G_00005, partial [Cyanobacteriota bacterium]